MPEEKKISDCMIGGKESKRQKEKRINDFIVGGGIKDSGERHAFDSGAVRDMEKDNRCDLMPICVLADVWKSNRTDDNGIKKGLVLDQIDNFIITQSPNCLIDALICFADVAYKNSISAMFLDVATHYSNGAIKYGERNWEKGIPLNSFLNRAIRHVLKYYDDVNDERHDRAFVWNVMGAYWTCKNRKDLYFGWKNSLGVLNRDQKEEL